MTNPQPTEQKAVELKPFDSWYYGAQDPETGMPYGTTLIYRVCENDPAKFEEANRIIEAAFEAGRAARPLDTRVSALVEAARATVEFLKGEATVNNADVLHQEVIEAAAHRLEEALASFNEGGTVG